MDKRRIGSPACCAGIQAAEVAHHEGHANPSRAGPTPNPTPKQTEQKTENQIPPRSNLITPMPCSTNNRENRTPTRTLTHVPTRKNLPDKGKTKNQQNEIKPDQHGAREKRCRNGFGDGGISVPVGGFSDFRSGETWARG